MRAKVCIASVDLGLASCWPADEAHFVDVGACVWLRERGVIDVFGIASPGIVGWIVKGLCDCLMGVGLGSPFIGAGKAWAVVWSGDGVCFP